QPQRFLGIELAHHHDAAADHVGVQREAAGRRVIERPRDEMHLLGIETIERGQSRPDGRGIDRSAERPFRLAGGARGVDHRAAHARAIRRRVAAAHGRRSVPSVIQCLTPATGRTRSAIGRNASSTKTIVASELSRIYVTSSAVRRWFIGMPTAPSARTAAMLTRFSSALWAYTIAC